MVLRFDPFPRRGARALSISRRGTGVSRNQNNFTYVNVAFHEFVSVRGFRQGEGGMDHGSDVAVSKGKILEERSFMIAILALSGCERRVSL